MFLVAQVKVIQRSSQHFSVSMAGASDILVQRECPEFSVSSCFKPKRVQSAEDGSCFISPADSPDPVQEIAALFSVPFKCHYVTFATAFDPGGVVLTDFRNITRGDELQKFIR